MQPLGKNTQSMHVFTYMLYMYYVFIKANITGLQARKLYSVGFVKTEYKILFNKVHKVVLSIFYEYEGIYIYLLKVLFNYFHSPNYFKLYFNPNNNKLKIHNKH